MLPAARSGSADNKPTQDTGVECLSSAGLHPQEGNCQLKLKIGTVLPLIISALAMMAVVSAGTAAYEAFGKRQQPEAFLQVNDVSRLLLRSASQWAQERGMTNGALKSPEALSPERRAEILKKREAADQAFREAAQRLRTLPAMKAAEKNITDAENIFKAFEASRSKVDQDLAKPASGRSPELVDGFVPSQTNLIDVAALKLRLTLETLAGSPTPALSQLVGLRHLTAQMAEHAGRERALLTGVIGARAKITLEAARKVAGFRGHLNLAWETISPMAPRVDVAPKNIDAITGEEKEYYRIYGETREAVLDSGESGGYKISSPDYFARATTGINAILQLADAIGVAADQEALNEASKSTSDLITGGAVLLASIGLLLVSFWIAFSRILRPLFALTGAMRELADGNFEVVLPGL